MSIVLILRGLVEILFGVGTGLSSTATWARFFELLSVFLIADGILAGGIGITLVRQGAREHLAREAGLGSVLIADAVGRIASGVALHFLPGISGFPVSSVVFVGIMAACTVAVGGAEAWLTRREEIGRHGASHQRGQFMAGPVGVLSLVSIAFGVVTLFHLDDVATVRLSISVFIVAAGMMSLAMAWSHRRMQHQRVAALAAAVV